MKTFTPQFVLIADDLTGSLDTGLQFRKKGLATLVPLKSAAILAGTDALVLNTDSRNLPGDLAYKKVYRTCRGLRARTLYKKIDSTMRGNVGREVLAILDALKIPKAIIVPSIPALNRTVERGVLRVHGTLLLRTSYAKDPFHPLWTSKVPDLLRKETGLPVGCLGLGIVRKGPETLAARIGREQARLIVLDAVLQSDLQSIAGAWRLLQGRVLACGSVGLADELMPTLREKKSSSRRVSRRRLLLIAGSRDPRTAEQIGELRRHFALPMIEPDLARLTSPRLARAECAAIVRRLLQILSREPGAILTTTFLKQLPGKELAISRAMGRIAARLLEETRLSGLVLTGGDLAMRVCERLSASALRIEEEVLPGIPCSTLIDGPAKGLRLVTKAGGFGAKEALWNIFQYLTTS